MEWHRIIGYRLGPDGISIEADLDTDPTSDWEASFGVPLDEDTEDAPRPTVDHRHLRVLLGEGSEFDALVLLADYVLAANSSAAA